MMAALYSIRLLKAKLREFAESSTKAPPKVITEFCQNWIYYWDSAIISNFDDIPIKNCLFEIKNIFQDYANNCGLKLDSETIENDETTAHSSIMIKCLPNKVRFPKSGVRASIHHKPAHVSHIHHNKPSLKIKKKSRTLELRTAILENDNATISKIFKSGFDINRKSYGKLIRKSQTFIFECNIIKLQLIIIWVIEEYLHLWAKQLNIFCFKHLLVLKVNPDAKNEQGNTCCHQLIKNFEENQIK